MIIILLPTWFVASLSPVWLPPDIACTHGKGDIESAVQDDLTIPKPA
jgi:hypothetical protein